MYKIKQKFNSEKIENIEDEVNRQFSIIDAESGVKPGMSIAVTAGSRGISNIPVILKSVCKRLKEYGAKPFIVPAMGSHGGATAEGQKMVLEKLGITEDTMGCPIISSMDVEEIGRTPHNVPVYMDKNAYHADGIIVINRVKPHTDFSAATESGLMKMISVGLGKDKGCGEMHSNGLARTIPEAAMVAIKKAPILFGIAILENSFDQTYKLKSVLPEDFYDTEKELLKEVKTMVPKIPADYMDVLIIDEMGKAYSGTGMDTKVIGRMKVFGEKEPASPVINKITVLNLADSSYGNALGIGLADLTTRKLVDKIDYNAMYVNTLHTTFLERAKIPIVMADEKEAVEAALSTIGNVKPEEAKVCIIKNTLNLGELYVSKALLQDMDMSKIELVDGGKAIRFDQNNNIILDWRKS